MNTTEKIIQFALQRKFGLNYDSSPEDIEKALGKQDGRYVENFMFYDDLEIGLNQNCSVYVDPFRKVSYFKLKIDGYWGEKQFRVPGIGQVEFKISDIDMREVTQVLVNHSIWFEHIPLFYEKDVHCGIRTLDQTRSFHFRKKRQRWLLDCYFCEGL